MTLKTWNGSTGAFSADGSWSPVGTPVSGDIAVINAGTVTATGVLPGQLAFTVSASSSSSGALFLSDATLGSTSRIDIVAAGSLATLGVAGAVANQGTITATGVNSPGGGAFVRIDNGSGGSATVFRNTGSILVSGTMFQVATFGNNPGNQLQNDGLISVRSPARTPQNAVISANITGTGTLFLGCCVTLEAVRAVSAGQTIVFERGVAGASTLRIDNAASFLGTISGFASSDRIELVSGAWNQASYTQTGANRGTLTLSLNGVTVKAQSFIGTYTLASFTLSPVTPTGSTQTVTTIRTTVAEIGPTARDATGDGKADILWRGAGGETYIWSLDGGSVTGQGLVGFAPTPYWSVKGFADATGDGKSDILWRGAGGETYLWSLDGFSISGGYLIGSADVNYWSISGFADATGDGKADVLWRGAGGEAFLWQLDGGTLAAQFLVGSLDANYWAIAGFADASGDGKADILWRGNGGEVLLWTLDGGTVSSMQFINAADVNYWTIVGFADATGDGRADILWRGNGGEVYLWGLDGGSITSNGQIGVIDTSYLSIVGFADSTGDAKADILFRGGGGETFLWGLDGSTLASSSFIGSANANYWSVVG